MKKTITFILITIAFASADLRSNLIDIIEYLNKCTFSKKIEDGIKMFYFICKDPTYYQVNLAYHLVNNSFTQIKVIWNELNIRHEIICNSYKYHPGINDICNTKQKDENNIMIYRDFERYNDKDFDILPLYLELKEKSKN